MLIFFFVLLATPDLIIRGEQGDLFFQPKDVTQTHAKTLYILSKNNRIFHFDNHGQLLNQFGGKGQGPGQLNLGFDLQWVEETQELWVADVGQQHISIFNAGGDFVRALKLETIGSLIRNGDSIILTPSDTDGIFLELSPKGEVQKRFSTDFVFPEGHYQDVSIWRSFYATPLQDNRILLGFMWANKLSIINIDGEHYRAWDMQDYYPEHRHENFPKYFSQLGVMENPDGTLWVLTCSHATKSCQEMLLFDYQQKALVGRAHADVGLRTFKRLADGRIAIIEAETDTLKVFSAFPYAVKRRDAD